jgi:pimeloyl-ACP methyl ester carboxylesterase
LTLLYAARTFEPEVYVTAEREPESRWIEANGARLHYVDWGGEGLPPMLLLHGLQDCCRLWDFYARSVCDRYHVISLDHRGHGDSAWTAGYPLEDYLQELKEVIEALDLRNLVLMGHSAGGKNSFIHTARQPERIARLVIHNPGSVAMVSRYRSESDEYPDFEAVVERIRSRQPVSSEEVLKHTAAVLTKRSAGGGYTWKRDRNVVLKYDRPDAWEYLPRISVPTLILRGADSTLLTGPVARRMQEQVPGSRLIELENAGHWVHLEQPDAFRRAVTHFIEAS